MQKCGWIIYTVQGHREGDFAFRRHLPYIYPYVSNVHFCVLFPDPVEASRVGAQPIYQSEENLVVRLIFGWPHSMRAKLADLLLHWRFCDEHYHTGSPPLAELASAQYVQQIAQQLHKSEMEYNQIIGTNNKSTPPDSREARCLGRSWRQNCSPPRRVRSWWTVRGC